MRTIIQAAARGTALTAACLAGLAASPAFAVPTSVLLHPGGALIHEEFSIKPEQDGRTLRFLLPADADRRASTSPRANTPFLPSASATPSPRTRSPNFP